MKNRTIALWIQIFLIFPVFPQTNDLSPAEIGELVQIFKEDPRGPFQAIRWYCPDGSVLPPDQRCPQPGGLQHAQLKPPVQRLAERQGIYLAQILAGTPREDFWDAAGQFTRAKQFVLEKFLFQTDDGWVLRRARYYRGAYQVEDEEAWGLAFFQWLLKQGAPLKEQYFLIRQLAMTIPHRAQSDHLIRIRALSKEIADIDVRFMDIRTKIHGQPGFEDISRVRGYLTENESGMAPGVSEKMQTLVTEMEAFYQETNLENLRPYLNRISPNIPVSGLLQRLLDSNAGRDDAASCLMISDLIWLIRQQILQNLSASQKLLLLDLSIDLEAILFRIASDWNPVTLNDLMRKAYVLAQAAAGSGFLEIWEWEAVEPSIRMHSASMIEFPEYDAQCTAYRRVVEWSSGMVYALFEPAVDIFRFEPMAADFADHCLRSSVVLPLGETAGILSNISTSRLGGNNRVMGIGKTSGIRGLNPGFSFGNLQVIPGSSAAIDFSPDDIYALSTAPASLTPVAGILTVSEGNLVSHVQLLARNLGIPNAVIAQTHLQALQAFHGRPVFYAVSPRGAVLMKPASKMTDEERQLVEVKSRNTERIEVSVEKLYLDLKKPVSLRSLKSSDSGRICGPKAANLAQLKQMFPEQVVNGIVIPFGVFDQHMNQMIPGKNITYWQMLHAIFKSAELGRRNSQDAVQTEKQLLERLAFFRDLLKAMPFKEELITELTQLFKTELGAGIGKIPVFIRSDTNMEDLKDFTGAGLNLTVFNVLEKEKILQGIRDVWMSPFTERSYRWRQKYLLNPENVYPSILIMPSVNVDKSGVMITTGVGSDADSDISVAFNRGAAGSVEGQASEQYLLRNQGDDLLISPSREPQYTTLPSSGGTGKKFVPFDQPVLTVNERIQLRGIAAMVRQKMTLISGNQYSGPYDVELGFQNERLYLFQVRPFVENKNARSSTYLQSLDPPIRETSAFRLDVPYESLIK